MKIHNSDRGESFSEVGAQTSFDLSREQLHKGLMSEIFQAAKPVGRF